MTLQAQQIAQYEKQLQEQSLLISELLRSNQELQEQVAYLIRKIYARSSEKTAAVFDGQIMLDEFARLFNEAETYADPNIEEPEPFVAPQKKTRSGYNRKEAFAALPEEEMVYKIDEAHRNCPKCIRKHVHVRHAKREPDKLRLLNPPSRNRYYSILMPLPPAWPGRCTRSLYNPYRFTVRRKIGRQWGWIWAAALFRIGL